MLEHFHLRDSEFTGEMADPVLFEHSSYQGYIKAVISVHCLCINCATMTQIVYF